MNWPQNLKVTDALKIGGVVIIAFVVLAIGIRLIGTPLSSLVGNLRYPGAQAVVSPMIYAGATKEMALDDVSLSTRNMVGTTIPQPQTPGTSGNDAENFEVVNYTGSIETNHLSDTCQKIVTLKSKDYVVFENSGEADTYCNYTFKVAKDHVAEVKSLIESLDPKELAENTYTIKNQVEDFTSETDILKKKAEVIDTTLKNALVAYDQITALAGRTQDASALAKVIDSKIQTIERLTQERLNINEQLDRLGRGKAQQLDRLDYTYFTINVYENKYLDGENLKDSWKQAVRQFFFDLNRIAQDLSLGLVTLLVTAIQFILYFFIVVIVAKYVWRSTKYIWNR